MTSEGNVLMITKDIFEGKTKDMFVTFRCDVCNDKTLGVFNTKMCCFRRTDDKKLHLIHLSSGVYTICSEKCLEAWCMQNFSLLDDEVKRKIPEDAYAIQMERYEGLDEMEYDVSGKDGLVIEDD